MICCSTYLCIHWLILVCALTGDPTCNLDIWGQHANQLSYLTRACAEFFLNFILYFKKSVFQKKTHKQSANTNDKLGKNYL